jgi:PmbA protein
VPESKGEDRMMKQIIKALKENVRVTDWLIAETAIVSSQAFYVLQKLETTRVANTTEYSVTVYHKFSADGKDFVGSSSFALSHKVAKKELTKMIDDAVFAASFIKNKTFEIVEGGPKKSWKESGYQNEPFVLLDQIANLFIQESSKNIRFNSLELFLTQTTTHIINSRGVDRKTTLNKVNVEAIPSYDGEKQNVELYKYYTYKAIDFEQIKNDAKEALLDVTARYNAEKIANVSKLDVILKDKDAGELFQSLIDDYSYVSVFKHNTDKKIGDEIQKDPQGDLLTIGLIPASKADAFDRDGVLLNQVKVIEAGKLVNYYGGNQYARYLGINPTGNMDTIEVPKGKAGFAKMTKKPHLEIIALSGIQIDTYSNYIGGEVRLANYFDGEKMIPVSGFSFSGNIDKCLSNLTLSKEMTKQASYQGPKYIKLPLMEIL